MEEARDKLAPFFVMFDDRHLSRLTTLTPFGLELLAMAERLSHY